jgi:hypothetical protein
MLRISDDNLHGRTVIASDGLASGEIAVLFRDSGRLRTSRNHAPLVPESDPTSVRATGVPIW